jgi:hypothetical protein
LRAGEARLHQLYLILSSIFQFFVELDFDIAVSLALDSASQFDFEFDTGSVLNFDLAHKSELHFEHRDRIQRLRSSHPSSSSCSPLIDYYNRAFYFFDVLPAWT